MQTSVDLYVINMPKRIQEHVTKGRQVGIMWPRHAHCQVYLVWCNKNAQFEKKNLSKLCFAEQQQFLDFDLKAENLLPCLLCPM